MKVAEFSRIGQVTVKTLRVYEELGLLVPASIDGSTGYRCYLSYQIQDLYKILALKDLGLSLMEIKLVLDKKPTAEQMRGMLILKSVQIRNKLMEEEKKLSLVMNLIERISKEERMSSYSVIIKNVDKMQIASVRDKIPSYNTCNDQFGIVNEYLGKNKIESNGVPLSIHHDTEYKDKDIDLECAFPVSGSPSEDGKVKIRSLDAGKFASTIHNGGYDSISDAYKAVFSWMESNKYKSNGPAREVYHEKPRDGKGSYVTEILVPITL